MDDNLALPSKHRQTFAQPLDKLIAGTRQETIPKVIELIKKHTEKFSKVNCYLVGDIVTKDFLANDFLRPLVQICIIDEMTQRERIESGFETEFEEIVELKNPAGTIPKESWTVIEDIINSKKRTCLRITEGEEDLLVMPLIIKLPLIDDVKQLVFYGQPPMTDAKPPIPQGIVVVNVNKRIQRMLQKFLDLMEKA